MTGVLCDLIESGFERARYYELDFNVPSSDRGGFGDLAVLAQSTSGASARNTQAVGYPIEWEATASFLSGSGRHVVCANARDFADENPSARPWVADIGLEGRAFVDIPVVRNGLPVGLIAADWPGETDDLSAEALNQLAAVGQMLGALPESAHLGVPTLSTRNPKPDKLVEDGCREIQRAIDAAFGAVFKLDWRTGTLRKVVEFALDSPGGELEPVEVEEPDYDIRDGFLTGRAWSSPTYRYVADITSLRSVKPTWIQASSFDGHSSKHGSALRTVLYSTIGHEEPRYLLRFINRADVPELPFLRRRRQVAAALGQQLASRFDHAFASQRNAFLATISGSAVANLHEPAKVLSEIGLALEAEGVESFAYVCIDRSGKQITFSHFSEGIGPSALPSSGKAVEELMALEADLGSSATIVDVPKGREISWPTDRALVTTSSSDESVAYLLTPVSDPSAGDEVYSRHLAPYCDLLTSSVETLSMYVSEEGARRALGYIGHEIGTPFTVLGDAAVAVALTGLEISDELGQLAPELRSRLRKQSRESYARIQRSRDEIDRVMEIAPVLASMGSGSINMYLVEADLAEIFRVASNRITTEMRGSQPVTSGANVRSKSRRFEIVMADSMDRLPVVRCDVGLLTQVALNLLRNAVKYSLPRHPPEPMLIRLSGRSMENGQVSVQVENWGWGIPPELQQKVLRPFVRGEIEDRLKSLQGMGLGLYLVNTIVKAHSGSVICRSRSTLDRPKEDEPLFGWSTEFEIRVPTDLEAGPASTNIDPYDDRGRER